MPTLPSFVLVAGATGGTGREIAHLLQQRRLPARVLSSRPEAAAALSALGEPCTADLMDPADAARAVQGVDTVLCAVGGRGAVTTATGGTIDDQGTIHLIDAAVRAGVRRFVLVTSIGVGETAEDIPAPLRAVLGKVLAAKQRAEERLRASGLAFTVLRPGGLSNEPATGAIWAAPRGLGGMIPRADVAYAAVASLGREDAQGQTLSLVSQAGARQVPPGAARLDWAW